MKILRQRTQWFCFIFICNNNENHYATLNTYEYIISLTYRTMTVYTLWNLNTDDSLTWIIGMNPRMEVCSDTFSQICYHTVYKLCRVWPFGMKFGISAKTEKWQTNSKTRYSRVAHRMCILANCKLPLLIKWLTSYASPIGNNIEKRRQYQSHGEVFPVDNNRSRHIRTNCDGRRDNWTRGIWNTNALPDLTSRYTNDGTIKITLPAVT